VVRALFPLLVTLFSAQLMAQTRIDSSTQEHFDRSVDRMKRELPASKAAELSTAIATLPFAGIRSFKDTPPDGIVKLDIRKLDGMSADEVIELAHKTVSVTFTMGPPPGLPAHYQAPLSVGKKGASAAPSVAGTAWEMTENANGLLSYQHVILRDGGVMDDGSPGHGRWEQLDAQVKITFNDGYAVYLGALDGAASLKGSAANINGFEWTWTARRSE
jgi:hypothetical protein